MGGWGRGYAARRFLLFSFPCSADHERDWPPCEVVFFGLATNTLNVRNNNNINNNIIRRVICTIVAVFVYHVLCTVVYVWSECTLCSGVRFFPFYFSNGWYVMFYLVTKGGRILDFDIIIYIL